MKSQSTSLLSISWNFSGVSIELLGLIMRGCVLRAKMTSHRSTLTVYGVTSDLGPGNTGILASSKDKIKHNTGGGVYDLIIWIFESVLDQMR